MPRGNKIQITSGEATVLTWNAADEETDTTAWRSALLSIFMGYRIIDPVTNNPAVEPVLNADLRGVFGRAVWQVEPKCGDLQTVDFDILQGESITLPAQVLTLSIVYPNSNQLPALPPPITRYPLEVSAGLGRGTARNSFVARRTVESPIVGAGLSVPARIPNYASGAILVNGNVAAPTVQIDFLTSFNGGIISSITLGKGFQNAAPVPQGALYYQVAGALDATTRVMFTLQV